jgi:hypothetical protein
MNPRPLDFNAVFLRDLQIKTLKAERRLLLGELIETDSRQKTKYERLSNRIKAVNKELFQLTGNPIYR